ncbi:hydrogenase [Algoriphagus kandeliae]|uniref:Hydrogenase n=1 Tax=Algoriphagus kandeliae TaxID=2562278 RepID=A0A4Y9QUJ1_9BACT|nr:hydrogenase [Algoriphagus kandeliae]TFV95827.1 hydrogenase [Algoriphagus kandeliae]
MEKSILIKIQSNRLIYWGVFLFLLGLVVGLMAPVFANPRMGVSSHIEGILNGMFLMILGLIWHKIQVSEKWLKITFWLAIYGTFMNWFGILLAAIFNGGKMLGIMAPPQESSPIVEGMIGFSLISLSIAMIATCIILLIGLRKNMSEMV